MKEVLKKIKCLLLHNKYEVTCLHWQGNCHICKQCGTKFGCNG